jgi:RNA polymerase sigma-70 factor (ECF subfamily)
MSTTTTPPIAQIHDAALLRRAQQGDADAFAVLYDRHAAAATRVAMRILAAAAAEDVVQEAFLTLWRAHGYDAEQGNVRSYLLAIVHNRSIDRIRRDARRNRDAPIDAVVEEHLPAPERIDEHAEQRELGQIVRAAVSMLPDAQRQAVELGYLGGMTHVEIAGVLGVPLGTVKSRMRLGLRRLGRDPLVAACL